MREKQYSRNFVAAQATAQRLTMYSGLVHEVRERVGYRAGWRYEVVPRYAPQDPARWRDSRSPEERRLSAAIDAHEGARLISANGR